MSSITDLISVGVNGTGTANYLMKWLDADTATDSVIYESSGNIGIGTTSPASAGSGRSVLHLNGVSGTGITFSKTGQANSYIYTAEADGEALAYYVDGEHLFYTTGSERLRIDASGRVGIGTSSPAYGLDLKSDVSSGAYFRTQFQTYAEVFMQSFSTAGFMGTANNYPLVISTNNTERMRIDASGNVGIGTSSPATTLHIVKAGTDMLRLERTGASAASVNLSVFGSGGSNYFVIGGDRNYSAAINNLTTASAANVFIGTDSNGIAAVLHRSTSSLKYKTEVKDYDKGLDVIETLRPVYYKGINDGDKQFAGLIAEEVHDSGLEEFVQYAEDGSPDALAYTHMVALLVNGIKELKAEIEILKSQING